MQWFWCRNGMHRVTLNHMDIEPFKMPACQFRYVQKNRRQTNYFVIESNRTEFNWRATLEILLHFFLFVSGVFKRFINKLMILRKAIIWCGGVKIRHWIKSPWTQIINEKLNHLRDLCETMSQSWMAKPETVIHSSCLYAVFMP